MLSLSLCAESVPNGSDGGKDGDEKVEGAEGVQSEGLSAGGHSYGGVTNGMDWRPRRWFTTGWTARERFWVDSK